MIKFYYSNHAKKRIKQRNLPYANEVKLVLAKKKYKRLIKLQCNKNRFKSNLFYFREDHTEIKKIPVYVCQKCGKESFVVITAFNINLHLLNK